MKILFITTFFALVSTYGCSQIIGKWFGALDVNGTSLNLVFNISGENGDYKATMDSPDQGATGIPIENITFENDTLNLSAPAMRLSYAGILNNNSKQIEGVFKQGAMEIPLVLSQNEIKLVQPNRPQTPKEPFPYYSENVSFNNPESGFSLAGTLTLPDTLKKYPVVILISGSGPQNRDEEILGHKPFLILADHLTKNGIGVLRYDDRGVGESTGDFGSATSADFATDVESAIAYLKTRKEIDLKKIGLIGHSEGGMIAPMVAAESKDVAFIALLAGPGIPIIDLMAIQTSSVAKVEGADDEMIRTNLQVFNRISNLITDNPTLSNFELSELLKKDLTAIFDTLPEDMKPPTQEEVERIIEGQSAQVSSNWYRFFISYDPQPNLSKVKCPVLALNGSLDVQVSSKENLAGIRKSLEEGRCKQFKIEELHGLNHLFQNTETGAVSEYAKIEQTLSDDMLVVLDTWLAEIVKD